MSEKIHLLHSHLDFFPENCGVVSDEHENVSINTFLKWRRDIKENGTAMLADYCWTLARDAPTMECRRQEKEKKIHDFVCVK